MVKKIIVKMMVLSARKGQPKGYITLLYPPDYEVNTDNLNSRGKTPLWIQSVKDRRYMNVLWDESGNVVKAIALDAEDRDARQRTKFLLSLEAEEPLWRWKTAFLPINAGEPP